MCEVQPFSHHLLHRVARPLHSFSLPSPPHYVISLRKILYIIHGSGMSLRLLVVLLVGLSAANALQTPGANASAL